MAIEAARLINADDLDGFLKLLGNFELRSWQRDVIAAITQSPEPLTIEFRKRRAVTKVVAKENGSEVDDS